MQGAPTDMQEHARLSTRLEQKAADACRRPKAMREITIVEQTTDTAQETIVLGFNHLDHGNVLEHSLALNMTQRCLSHQPKHQ
jgi:hypothetical protein